MTFRPIIVACAAIMAAAPYTGAMAQAPEAFRTRPITLIVPFPAGGPSDALARAVAQGMAAQLRQSIVVENISGAGQSRPHDLWQRRPRLDLTLRLRYSSLGAEAEHHACTLSRCRAGNERPHRRPYRLHVRSDHDRVGASRRRKNQSHRGAERSAAAATARRGDSRKRRLRCQYPGVERHFAPARTPPPVIGPLNDALRAAIADAALARQMQAVGVDLPTPEQLAPAVVSDLIARGLERDVPALKARGEYLD